MESAITVATDHVREENDATRGQEHDGHEHGHIELSDVIRILLTAAIAALVWFRVWEPFSHLSLLGLTGILLGGYPIFRERSRTYASAA